MLLLFLEQLSIKQFLTWKIELKSIISHNVCQGISIKDGGYDGGVLFSSYSP